MKRIGSFFYNIIFWISRFITIVVFGTCFFAVLNAKYILAETFFLKLLKIFSFFSLITHKISDFFPGILSSLDLSLFNVSNIDANDIFAVKYDIYKLFCSNSQNIDVLIYAFVSILLIYFVIRYLFKNKQILFAIILEIFSVYLCIYLFTNNLNFLFLSFVSINIFMILYFFNLYLPLQNIIILFPIIGEIFCINRIFLFITKKQQKETFILMISIIISSVIYIFIPYNYNNSFNNLIIKNNGFNYDIYNICVDDKQDRFAIASYPIMLFNNTNGEIQRFETDFDLYQEAIFDWKKEEIYVYSTKGGIFYIIDMNTRKEKAKIEILNSEDSKHNVCVRLAYDSTTNFILIIFESEFGAFLIDLEKLQIIQKYEILSPNECGIYNKFRKSFILSSYQNHKFIQELDVTNGIVSDIFVGLEQGDMAISEQNKELYIPFHQQGKISVYDAETMEFKRKIRSNYTVKDITYDEDLNVLIAPSYFTGYVDIFLMDGSDKLLTREFVGYDLRQARFDTKKENLYICSRHGLYKLPINIKELIKKNS